VLLFELATGQLPFPIRTLDDAVQIHRNPAAAPPIRPDLPERLEAILSRAMEKNWLPGTQHRPSWPPS
jgi:hypothetical protein